MRYKNLARIEEEDAELLKLETEYHKQYGEVDPDEKDEVTTKEVETEKSDNVNWKKRYTDLQSYIDKKENEKLKDLSTQLEETKRQLREAEQREKGIDQPETIEQAREWVENYPDLAKVLRVLFREEMRDVEANVSAMKEDLEKKQSELLQKEALTTVKKVHPDFEQIISTEQFTEWLNDQPRKRGRIGQGIWDALNSFDAEGAIEAISIFKSDTKRRPSKAEELETVKAVHTSRNSAPMRDDNKPVFHESQIENMHPREYDRLEDAIDEARREGRIIYDLSGAAR